MLISFGYKKSLKRKTPIKNIIVNPKEHFQYYCRHYTREANGKMQLRRHSKFVFIFQGN